MRSNALQLRLRDVDTVRRSGRVREIFSTHIEADGPNVPLGTLCAIEGRAAGKDVQFTAEVVRIGRTSVILSPLDDALPTFSGARVVAEARDARVPVGAGLLGRIVDGLGRPIDGAGKIVADGHLPLHGSGSLPLDRETPDDVLETGIRAIDGLLTLGRGQRIGLFAASGVGKTSLLTQIAQQTRADVTVVCLIGERGREVEALWNSGLSKEARGRTTMVAATSDHSAALRVRAGFYAMAIADYWRSRGAHVLLLMDSVTRLAMAMREVGLAAGEPPTVRAYPPSIFSAIPKLVERCGAIKGAGAITAIMTVLSETDEIDDPVCEMMKSLLDGHILLSRELAEQGHFPAIDVPRSISRHAEWLNETDELRHARRIVEWLSLYNGSKTLIDAGLYSAGSNPALDIAIAHRPAVLDFLKQDRTHSVSRDETMAELRNLARRSGS